MPAKTLLVVGIGGFGRETLDVVDAINAQAPAPVWAPVAVDDHPSAENLARLERRGGSFLGNVETALGQAPTDYVIAIGNPAVRRRIAARFDSAEFRAATLIHPASTQGSDVTVGAGAILCAGSRITTNVVLGRHVHLNPNATVGHDTVLGDFVSLNPQAAVSGDCVVEDDVLLGVGSILLNQRRVGRGAVVGAGACVTRDVAPEAVVKGVPAR